MTDNLKVLGQSNPSANVLTALYTVPIAAQATISSIAVCNQSNLGVTFRVSVAINGAADSPQQYLYYDIGLDSNDTFIATIGMSLASGDVVRIQASSASLSFNLFGVEIT